MQFSRLTFQRGMTTVSIQTPRNKPEINGEGNLVGKFRKMAREYCKWLVNCRLAVYGPF